MRIALLVAAASLIACSTTANTSVDAGRPDVGQVDAGTLDSGLADAGTDAGEFDAGEFDAGDIDADAGPLGASIATTDTTFIPLDVTVGAGGTITIHNNDSVPHTFTSQPVIDQFTPGGVSGVSFDTGSIASGGTVIVNIPSNAPFATVIPFYCTIHGSTTGSGTVTIQ